MNRWLFVINSIAQQRVNVLYYAVKICRVVSSCCPAPQGRTQTLLKRSASRVMNALARSLAAPSGVLCPVGKPSDATLNFGFATAVARKEDKTSTMRVSLLEHSIREA